MSEEPRLLGIKDVAQKIKVSEKHVRKLIKTRGLPYVDLGTGVMVIEENLWEWVRSQVTVEYQDGEEEGVEG